MSEIRFRNPIKGVGFGQLYHIITVDPELSDGAYRTYATYLMYAQQSLKAWPGRGTVSDDRDKDEATITRHNQELEGLGYIARERRFGKTSITWIEDAEENPRLLALASARLEGRNNAPSNSAEMRPRSAQKRAAEEEPRRRIKEELPPIGGDDADEPVLVAHDLEEVVYLMEGTGHKKDDLEAQCPECGAAHEQDMNVCPDCGAHVVWHNSRVWKKEYGKPKDYVRRMTQDLKPETPLQVEACQKLFKGNEFANVTAKKTFRSLERNKPDAYLKQLIEWAKNKGFQAFVSAVKNQSNYDKWYREQYETTQPGAVEQDTYQPSGWMITALESVEEEHAYGPIYGED